MSNLNVSGNTVQEILNFVVSNISTGQLLCFMDGLEEKGELYMRIALD